MVDIFETTPNNESIAAAQNLVAGTYTVSGVGQDFWRIDAYNPGLMTFSMVPNAAAATNVNLELWNSAGQVIKANFDPLGPLSSETITHISSGNEIYYLRVYNAAFPAPTHQAPKYDLQVTLPTEQWPQPEYEPNDTLQTAKPLVEGNYQISGRGNDWFSIATNPGATTITMTPSTGADVNLELYNSAGQVIQAAFAPGQETINFNADGSTYYLRTYLPANPAGGSPFYRLNVDLNDTVWPAPAFESNDTLQTAKPLTEGSYKISGISHDYFRIDGRPGQMTFSMTPADTTDVNMVLLGADGNQVKANLVGNVGAAGRETFSFFGLTEQTYYLHIYNAANPTGRAYYDLNVELPNLSWSKVLNFGPIREASIGMFDLDNDGKDEIVVGTSKQLDAQGNETLPAGLVVLEDDGTVKWTVSFPAMTTPDPVTGKVYNTTSVSTAPLFTDVDGDGVIDIVVGVGGDNRQEKTITGQPGDKGGVYAVSSTGQIKWFHQSRDSFGNNNPGASGPDGRPDGIYGYPQAFDIDADGVNEVIFTGLDHHLYILDGRTGQKEREIGLLDTNAATVKIADINGDGVFEIITGGDITTNPAAGTVTGGILHVISAFGNHNIEGWNKQILNSTGPELRGYYSPQTIWSGPQTADLDGNGSLEVIYGSGSNVNDASGDFVTVRNSDGSLRFSLPTNGRPASAPLVADINGDGRPDIVQGTFSGWVHAWDWQGQQIFATKLLTYEQPANTPYALTNPASAADLNGDGKLELLFAAGGQIVFLNHLGQQIHDQTKPEYLVQSYGGTVGVRDIDKDGRLDIISGGNNVGSTQATVFRYENLFDHVSTANRDVAYQAHQNLSNIDRFVDRFYSTILKREADPTGNNYWNDSLYSGVRSGEDVARGFIFSQEFTGQNTDNATFVNTLYSAFFNRAADQGGFDSWMALLQGGTSRSNILDGFIFSQEFKDLCARFGIRPSSSLGPDAGPGDNTLKGALDADLLRAGGGNDTLTDRSDQLPTNPDIAGFFGQIYRLYAATLGREPDPGGYVNWVDVLVNKVQPISQVTEGFVNSQEFRNTYGSNLSNEAFVTLLYNNVLGRAPDAGGLAAWTKALVDGMPRWQVVGGFSDSQEHINKTGPKLVEYMQRTDSSWNDVLEGGQGNDTMSGGLGADTYIFRAGQVGNDTIYQFEGWDVLQLSGFGYTNPGQPLSKMTQQGSDVVFNDKGQVITFKNTTLATFNTVRWNLS